MEGDGGHEAIQLKMAEEEALKRNTDCIYFLASPFTCKKGSECDYRHSEGARFNCRDCWYWLNGNCLNPKCSFRHPPLGSLFATEMPSPLPSQTSAPTFTPAARPPNNGYNKCVPCYYFQRGQCLKGKSCPFMHGLPASVNSLPQQVTTVSMPSAALLQSNDQNAQKKISVQQDMQEFRHDSPKTPVNMHFELVSSETVELVTKAGNAPKHEPSEIKILPPHSLDEEPPALSQNGVSVNNGYFQSQQWNNQVQPTEEEPDNGRDADEFLGEHSPGFDVLVEDDIEDPDYYHNEDNFRRMSAHGGRNMEAVDECDYQHNDYEPITKVDQDQYNGMVRYGNYELPHDRHGLESKTALRILERASSVERRVTDRETKIDAVCITGSDLRYQLNKRRRFNGTQSTSNHGCHNELYRRDEQYVEERHYCYHSHDDMKFPPEQFISCRLQGRIAFPIKSVADATNNMFSEKERGRGSRSICSPTRRTIYKTRYSERTRRQPSEIFTKDERIHREKTTLKDGTVSLDFASPKSLAELRSATNNENIQEIKVTGSNNLEGLYESENPLYFEGPLPLTAILKRKRELTYVENEVSTAQHENNQSGYSSIHELVPQLEANTEGNTIVNHDKGMIHTENGLAYHSHSPSKANALETEDDTGLENAEEEEMETSDKQDGDFNYESGKDKEIDHKNTPHPSEEDDLDEDDDFATKVSEMLS
ncbi:zinc finger CCCH domain-containing protein 32-like [Zingiber officinale]|uniref:C3H1-type domain-containing protein n=1 Tax=Zingiber officinale TaxID=94328 RepID=A0A8J5H4E1_ZINOF|nr:zinc finger CCCH domain-containing protein 32-like [Zingiber officinale]KAG6520115.1 hypothetical protein ZIOFF_017147 [Zingiber officinale]